MSRSLFARLAARHGPRIDPVTRRQFLAATLAASAAVLAGCALPRRDAGAKPSGKQIVVVGAGFAGLACAHELLNAGSDVTMFEARRRVGGRVLSFTDFVPGKVVEGGGELIGSNHPVWVAYAERFGLEFLDVTEAEDAEFPIVLGGRRLSAAESESLYEEMDAALQRMNADAARVDADQPWRTSGAAALDARTTKQWIESLDCAPLCRHGLTVQFASDNGQDVARQSYLGNLAQVKGGGLETYWTESEVYRCRGGNQQLADRLADAVGRERIHMGAPVRSIEDRGERCVVTGADGRVVECDTVVLAVPPTVWDRIDIRPALPAAMRPQMGVNVKHLSYVRSRFWRQAGLAPDSLTDGDVSMTWEGTDNQPGDEGACLTCFSGGPAAEAVRARVGDARAAAYRGAIGSIYAGYADQVRATRFMDWPGDEWTRTGYSFPAPGQVTTVGPLLRAGVGNIRFAGEHACYAFVGYMEGGLQSGLRAAKSVLASPAH
ncbi:MAG: flavin monoamine oxidase family protein [Phycisphaerales bacterium]